MLLTLTSKTLPRKDGILLQLADERHGWNFLDNFDHNQLTLTCATCLFKTSGYSQKRDI